MSGLVNVSSTNEWQSLLSGTSVVVADFYADWCGPCKMIAPAFERLAKEHSAPRKVAFAKVNVDSQPDIARSQGVAAMPTFKIFHNGSCIETIKGANPSALSGAVTKAVQLAGSGPTNVFKTTGHTLSGGTGTVGGGRSRSFSISGLLQGLITMVGLYLVSLFSLDPYKSAQQSSFNIHQPRAAAKPIKLSSEAGGARAPPRAAFKTLADLDE